MHANSNRILAFGTLSSSIFGLNGSKDIALPGLAALFTLMALYGLWSFPGVVSEWGFSPVSLIPLLIWVLAAAVALPLYRAAPGRAAVAGMIILLIALRLWPLMLVSGALPVGDAAAYPQMARDMLAGKGLGVDEPFIGLHMAAFYPPIYPLLLAGWAAIAGLSASSLTVLNLIIDGASASLIWRFGRRLGHENAGRAAAWLYLIWPVILLASPYAQKEGLTVLLSLGLIHLWLSSLDTVRPILLGTAIGALTGLLALTQPAFAPLAGLIGLAFVTRMGWRKVFRIGCSSAAALLLVMMPWWIRNALVLHAFVPLTTAGGVSLWVGNNPDATGNWMPTPANIWHASEVGYGHITGQLAAQWISTHPTEFIRLTLTKFVRAMGVDHFGVVRLGALQPSPSRLALSSLVLVEATAHLAVLAGMAAAFWRRRNIPVILTALILVAFAQMLLFGVWFEFGERHRIFLLPLSLLAIAIAFTRPRRDAVQHWCNAAPAAPNRTYP